MIDFHNHLMPGVDDGASDPAQALEGLGAMWADGVRTVVTTPHFRGSLTRSPEAFAARMAELDAAWGTLRALGEEHFPALRLERGVEISLDAPELDLSDARVRLGGSPFALIEFHGFSIPPRSANAFFQLKRAGVTPILAHPERYPGMLGSAELVDEWRSVGARLQVNAGSVLGRYGEAACQAALALLGRGEVSYLCSDYHSRGRLWLRQAHDRLVEMGGSEQAELLTVENPSRMLAGEPPLPVPPLQAKRRWWSPLKIFG
ncbi:MAG TPA: CpsB/CapC family capsule biosynthesis tyrosine phosphatase [Longimicrobium sp.]|jgi:protein-tyrosine phosphatase